VRKFKAEIEPAALTVCVPPNNGTEL